MPELCSDLIHPEEFNFSGDVDVDFKSYKSVRDASVKNKPLTGVLRLCGKNINCFLWTRTSVRICLREDIAR